MTLMAHRLLTQATRRIVDAAGRALPQGQAVSERLSGPVDGSDTPARACPACSWWRARRRQRSNAVGSEHVPNRQFETAGLASAESRPSRRTPDSGYATGATSDEEDEQVR